MQRRQMLKIAGVAAFQPFQILTGATRDKVRLGVIGSGNRGQALMRAFTNIPAVEITAISDVNEPVMDQALTLLDQLPRRFHPAKFAEYERMLDRKDVDAVLIATPEHSHGLPFIQACQAGKHVYVEKPVSHNVVEGRRMVQAARKSGVIAVAGTQQRASPHFMKAVEVVQSGRLGRIPKVHCWNTQKSGTRFRPVADCDPPAGLHWDRWLGPARRVPFNPMRLEHRLWMDYAGVK
jgi:predicted dehydrogenase